MGNEVTKSKPINIFPGAEVEYQIISKDSESQNSVEVIYIDPKKVGVKLKVEKDPTNFYTFCTEWNNNILVGAHTKIEKQTGTVLIYKSGKVEIYDPRKVKGEKEIHARFAIHGELVIEPKRKKVNIDSEKKRRSILAVTKNGKLILFTFYHKVSLSEAQDYILNKFPKVIGAIELASGEKTSSCINSDNYKNFLPPENSPRVFEHFFPK